KICCFGYLSADDLPAKEMAPFPEARTPVGLGTVDKCKPVLAFFGDDFLPIFYSVGQLEEDGLDDGVEITGLGNAGLELVRMYPAGKVLTTTPKAVKAVRAGIPDLIVVSESCCTQQVVAQALKSGIPVVAVGPCASYPVPDRSDEPADDLVARLRKGEGFAVHAMDKGAGVVSGFFKDFAGKMGKGPEAGVIDKARQACTSCDLCFHECPLSLTIGPALKGSDNVTLTDLYDRCHFCGQCEAACPENIPVMDCLLAASEEKIAADNYRMRPGRGPLSHLEFRDLTFGLMLGGNGPAMVALLGCGQYPGSEQDMADIAEELLNRNCVVMTAGCGASDISRKLEEKTGKSLPENYPNMATLKGLVNCGGCAGDAHIMSAIYKLSQLGGGISVKGNFDQQADYIMNRAPFTVLLWGAASEKMYTKAAGFARIGARVVVGPTGFTFPRMLVGNKYERENWTMYDGFGEGEREVDPTPAHLILPVETKEEALTMILKYSFTTCDLRDSRLSSLDNYTGVYQKYFGELPDDWNYFIRSQLEIHVMKRMKFLKILREKYGWDIEGATVKRVKDRNGNLVSVEQYTNEYGIKQGRYATMIPRLIMQQAVALKEE
ncbi:MAG: hypothetical protein GY868_13575, partial [Deltaproteobacteria bacterium]|nr:hypothetical protein [Deltaproteobacteria bacterium]